MKKQKLYIPYFHSKINYSTHLIHSLCFSCILILMLGTGNLLNAQQPEFTHPPQLNPFGLSLGSNILALVKFVDLDHDDTLEAFVQVGAASWRESRYYENQGSNTMPDFVYVEDDPFGIPGGFTWKSQFVDIDGDGLDELFYSRFTSPNAPVRMVDPTGTPEEPDYGHPLESNPYGITLPVGEDGDLIDYITPTLVDIDNDGDFDLFYGGLFINGISDEAFHWAENTDPSGNGTAPQFSAPMKDPFGLIFPEGDEWTHWVAFADMDCDGDQDMYMNSTFESNHFRYFENFGTPEVPEFSEGVCITAVCEHDDHFAASHSDFIDIGGDGDLDVVGGGGFWGAGIRLFENISPAPVAGFDYNSVEEEVSFTDASLGQVTKWLWDFGDGTTSEEEHPQHTYADIGSYQVCLTVWYQCTDESDEICESIEISVGTKVSQWNASVSLFPNPAKNRLLLKMEAAEPLEKVDIEIFDLTGKIVVLINRELSGKTLQEDISLAALSDGIYTLKVSSKDKFVVRKFVKTE